MRLITNEELAIIAGGDAAETRAEGTNSWGESPIQTVDIVPGEIQTVYIIGQRPEISQTETVITVTTTPSISTTIGIQGIATTTYTTGGTTTTSTQTRTVRDPAGKGNIP